MNPLQHKSHEQVIVKLIASHILETNSRVVPWNELDDMSKIGEGSFGEVAAGMQLSHD
ncbi:3215_t:CDS:2 [Dentiscutata erythropus]|uniref:3215_t:CDS:1 n=1 Tax=Dentiscutata erythropus TaxID=1348616 RepID=A0A9N8ZHP0_9GLOM|nr:3215_t:CDS:2 [Dentiscutata erythropus]